MGWQPHSPIPPHSLIDCPDLVAVAQSEGVGEAGAAVGVEGGA